MRSGHHVMAIKLKIGIRRTMFEEKLRMSSDSCVKHNRNNISKTSEILWHVVHTCWRDFIHSWWILESFAEKAITADCSTVQVSQPVWNFDEDNAWLSVLSPNLFWVTTGQLATGYTRLRINIKLNQLQQNVDGANPSQSRGQLASIHQGIH